MGAGSDGWGPGLVRSLGHSESSGPGGRVVLLHGWAADSRVWGPLMAALGRRVGFVAPDLPGHGATPLHLGPDETISAAAVDRFSRWCATRGLEQAPMVGWAWGSQVLVQAVASGSVDPVSVLLVAYVPPGEVPDPYKGPLSRDWPKYVRSIVRLLTASPLSVDTEGWLAGVMASCSIAAAGGIHALPIAPPGDEFRLPPHSRAILGSNDRIADPEQARRLVLGWGGQVVLMADTGHVPFLERPVEFQRHFLEWLTLIGVNEAAEL